MTRKSCQSRLFEKGQGVPCTETGNKPSSREGAEVGKTGVHKDGNRKVRRRERGTRQGITKGKTVKTRREHRETR